MNKLLRIGIPALQVALVITAYVLPKFAYSYSVYLLRDLVDEINFPVASVWYAIFRMADRLFGRSFSASEAVLVVAVVAIVCLVLLTVAGFWYFVVVEMQRRRRGESSLRFKTLAKQLPITILLVGFAIVAFVWAYLATQHSLDIANLKVDKILGWMILVAWGAVLLWVAMGDLRRFFTDKRLPSRTD